jgi:NADPH-dependent 2,4-dienoyl-CoA reductase/sulfur reductase-like enzyme
VGVVPVPRISVPAAPRSVAVVGAGLAAAGVVSALRTQGFDGRITVLGAEGVAPYDRPPLSKELLTRTEPVWLADDIGADISLADDVRLAEPAVGLAAGPRGWAVRTARDEVAADVVVLATGARAVIPPGWEAAATLHTVADAATLRAGLVPGKRLVVVGAGWIGAEVAGVAAAGGVQVTVVEAAGAPLTAALGAVGALTEPWYAAAGVRLLTGALVVGVSASTVELADGEVLHADVVLAAVGARPASDWSDALPVAADGSVLVDAGYRVLGGPPGLVAVGDVARRRSARHGWVLGGHWDGALRGPAIAVRALLGGPAEPDDPAPYVFSTQLGHELTLHGKPGADDDVVLRGDPGGAFGALWFRPGTDVLTAALAVDSPRDVSAARRMFAGASLPHLDRAAAGDAARPLREVQR